MNFLMQPPSTQWANLSFRGVRFAEVWLKPESDPLSLIVRIPQKNLIDPDINNHLTIENILRAIGIVAHDVDSWRHDDESHTGLPGYLSEWNKPLPPVPEQVAQLYLHVRMKHEAQAPVSQISPEEVGDEQTSALQGNYQDQWQKLEARWNTILIMEVNIDTMRLRMETLRGEVESASSKVLSTDEKMHALNADVAQWNKAKSRARYAVPKVKEFIHRATWALGSPERKKLEELFKNHTPPETVLPQLDAIHNMLENLFKDRQILAAQGVTGLQEGKNSCDDVQKTYRTLQSNAASNAAKKRVATRAKNK